MKVLEGWDVLLGSEE